MIRRSFTILATGLALGAAVAAPAAHAAPFALDLHFTRTPAKLTRQATPLFRFARNVAFRVRSQTCQIDTAAWTPCRTPWSPGRLADGTHTARVRLEMGDGRVAALVYSWTIDTEAPAPPDLAGIGDSWIAAPQVVTLGDSAADVHHYLYRVNGGSPIRGSQITVSAEGVTTISAAAVDRAGNMSPPAVGTVKLDSSAPQVTAPSLPRWTDQISIPLPDATDDGSGVATAEWRASNDDGQTWTAWVPAAGHDPATVATDGQWTFAYRVTDLAGNATTVTFDQSQDSTPPQAPSLPNVGTSVTWHSGSHLTVTPSANDPGGSGVDHYLYRLNGGPEQTLGTGDGISITDSGVTTVSVVALDAMGNRSAATTGEVGLDDVAPQIATPHLPVWAQHIGVTVSDLVSDQGGSGLAGALWEVRAAGTTDWSAPHSMADDPEIRAPGDGSWEFIVRAWDNAGNSADVQFGGGEDSSPPPPPTVSGGTGSSPVARAVPISAGPCCEDPQSGLAGRWQYEISTDGGTTWSVPVEYTAPFTPTDPGTYVMRARSLNTVGLWSEWSVPNGNATEIFAPPVPAVPVVTGGHGSGPDNATSVVFQWNAVTDPANPGFQVQYQVQQRLNGGAWQNVFTVPFTGFVVNGSGCLLVEVRVRAQGSSGYWSDWSQVTAASTDRLCG